jgi:hypothetical protein
MEQSLNTLVQNDTGSSLLSLQYENLGHFVTVCLRSASAVADICAKPVSSRNNVNVNHVYFIYINAFYRSIVKLLIYVPKFVLYAILCALHKVPAHKNDVQQIWHFISYTFYLEQQKSFFWYWSLNLLDLTFHSFTSLLVPGDTGRLDTLCMYTIVL